MSKESSHFCDECYREALLPLYEDAKKIDYTNIGGASIDIYRKAGDAFIAEIGRRTDEFNSTTKKLESSISEFWRAARNGTDPVNYVKLEIIGGVLEAYKKRLSDHLSDEGHQATLMVNKAITRGKRLQKDRDDLAEYDRKVKASKAAMERFHANLPSPRSFRRMEHRFYAELLSERKYSDSSR